MVLKIIEKKTFNYFWRKQKLKKKNFFNYFWRKFFFFYKTTTEYVVLVGLPWDPRVIQYNLYSITYTITHEANNSSSRDFWANFAYFLRKKSEIWLKIQDICMDFLAIQENARTPL